MLLMRKKVLVLCTGNSCRSIMAEALINHLAGDKYEAVSAGSKPAGYVHPKAISTLEGHSIKIDNPQSKSWDVFEGEAFDFVITVCDAAATESCPVFFGAHEKRHWGTADPAAATGTEEEIEQAFKTAFDFLKTQIVNELQ